MNKLQETLRDSELVLEWVNFNQDLKITAKGELVYSTVTGKVSPKLSERQVKWIGEHVAKTRRSYVFAE